jgi:hypothetical protein
MYSEKTFDVTTEKGVKVGEILAYANDEYAGAELRVIHPKDISWIQRCVIHVLYHNMYHVLGLNTPCIRNRR